MAHFAEVVDGLVLRVLVTDNKKPNEGHDWLLQRFGGTWIKTSYNTYAGKHLQGGTSLRKNFAGIGYTYDADRDAFISPKPFESWELDEDTCQWQSPVPYPEDTETVYQWDEDQLNWVAVAE
jgi:hypothetical protein